LQKNCINFPQILSEPVKNKRTTGKPRLTHQTDNLQEQHLTRTTQTKQMTNNVYQSPSEHLPTNTAATAAEE